MLACLARGNLLDVFQEGFTEQQLQAYVAWVNSQTRKKPGVRLVQDLRLDLRDGVILSHLIEIVAGEKLSGIHLEPSSQQEMRENVEKILQFVASKHIRMHQTFAKDIVEGNLKSVMRLILALAAHFKPSASVRSVNHRTPAASGTSQDASSATHRPHSATAMAQSAATALAEVRQDVSRSGREVFRYRTEFQRTSSTEEEIESPCWSVRALVQQYEGQRSVSESESSGLSSPSPTNSARTESITSQPEEPPEMVIAPSQNTEKWTDEPVKSPSFADRQAGNPGVCLDTSWEEQLLEQQDQLENEMEEARKMISTLQALLLNGSLPEDEQEASFALCEDRVCPEEQLVIIRSRLDQSMEENQDLKKELLKYKQEARNLQGVKVDQQRKIEERNRLLGEYKKELGQKERLLQQQQAKLDEILRKLSEANHHKANLQRELEHKDILLQQFMNREQEQKVSGFACHSSQSNGYLQTGGKGAPSAVHRGVQTDDLQLVRDALRSLRNSFSGHDPQHHTIDSLEQGISSLMERLHLAEVQQRQEKRSRVKSAGNRPENEYRDSWPPSSKMVHSLSTPTVSSTVCTKVLYFTDRSLTPFMVNISKRLGEVTLKDFKMAIDREGSYRYHFKALDPEFGTVKEEVFHDDDVIPGWEGKIVAWVEEDLEDNR
ncbi:dixin isoform X1 [Latimeria chalumnae]|uniref:dixin isoform X1 n=1 Tax=Latimeria chalumnae TaxID=7897 RepID=UPI00313D686B